MVVGASVTASAAILGNAFVGKDSLTWFRDLKAPRWQLPMPGFLAVAAAYYAIMAIVMARGIDRRDGRTITWAVTVLAANESWNGLLFGRRSPRAAFFGLLVFLLPLTGLQLSVWRDKPSRWTLLPYTVYVVTYDMAWAHRLWQLNPAPAPRRSGGR